MTMYSKDYQKQLQEEIRTLKEQKRVIEDINENLTEDVLLEKIKLMKQLQEKYIDVVNQNIK